MFKRSTLLAGAAYGSAGLAVGCGPSPLTPSRVVLIKNPAGSQVVYRDRRQVALLPPPPRK
jgi:hypothetical protein